MGLISRISWVMLLLAGLSGCANGVNLGVSLPIGRHVGVGVSVGSDGRVSTGVGVSVGGGSVSVGTSGRMPASSGHSTDETTRQP